MSEWTIPISLVAALGGFLLSYLSNRRTAKKDAEDAGKSMGAILTELAYITRTLNGLTEKMDAQNAKHGELSQDVHGDRVRTGEVENKVKENAERNSRDHAGFHKLQRDFEKCRAVNTKT